MGTKKLSKEEGNKLNINRLQTTHKSGSLSGMKKLYYSKDALLVRCGNWIYNVSSKPEIYEMEH